MSGIFISYRRDDSEGWVTGLAHTLRERFGADQVFRDIDTLAPGLSYTQAIEQRLAQCSVVLVIIGPRWLAATDKAGRRRLDDPRDLARLEVATVLRREIPVVPVLVGRASMPTPEELPEDLQELTYRHAYDLSDRRWDYDLEELIRILEGPAYLDRPAKRDTRPPQSRSTPDQTHVQHSVDVASLTGSRSIAEQPSRTRGSLAITYLIFAFAGFITVVASILSASYIGDIVLPGQSVSNKDMFTTIVSAPVIYIMLVVLMKRIDMYRQDTSFGRLVAFIFLPSLFVMFILLNANPDSRLSVSMMLAVLICMPYLLNRRALLSRNPVAPLK